MVETVKVDGVNRPAEVARVAGALKAAGRLWGPWGLWGMAVGNFISSSDKTATDLAEGVVVGDNLIAGADHDWAGERA